MRLTESIYGLFDQTDYTFVSGRYPIRLDSATYTLESTRVMRLLDGDLKAFPELVPIYKSFSDWAERSPRSIPCVSSLLVPHDEFRRRIKRLTRRNISLERRASCLARPFVCLVLHILHETDDDPFEYMNRIRDQKGIDQARNVFLTAVREFHNYHIILRTPHIYVTDIHCRSIDGIFAYFSSDRGKVLSEARVLSDYWTPKLRKSTIRSAKKFFDKGSPIPILDLLVARAHVYAERQHLSLAVIHAVMALEVIVPAFINAFLIRRGVSKAVVEDFNKKFGLSVRVKGILKTILPVATHPTIEVAGRAIKTRNAILHDGLAETSLLSNEVAEMVTACSSLVGIIKKKQRATDVSNKQIQPIAGKPGSG